MMGHVVTGRTIVYLPGLHKCDPSDAVLHGDIDRQHPLKAHGGVSDEHLASITTEAEKGTGRTLADLAGSQVIDLAQAV